MGQIISEGHERLMDLLSPKLPQRLAAVAALLAITVQPATAAETFR